MAAGSLLIAPDAIPNPESRVPSPESRAPSEPFERRFAMQEAETLAFLHTDDRDFPVWWTAHPEQAPIVVAWCGGPDAARLSERSAEQLRVTAVSSLAKSLRLSRARMDGLIE